ncbi:DUF6343 family protein [Streptomyces sp. enrichment culture]|uniref:DUF6343 family protein n=1 Tax=Streptomyces sp. enrichment culture TaxID=1795815 RepID=UPI003F544BE4
MHQDPRSRPEEPVPRSRSGTIGRRFPRTGTEPVTARSPLGLRALLSGFFLPVFCAATVLFALWAAGSDDGDSPGRGPLVGITVLCAVLALIAAADLVVVLRRRRRERGSSAPGR